MNCILVTGGCGFIGSNFIEYMLNKYNNIQVVNLDLLTYAGSPKNVSESIQNDFRYTFVRGNICNKILLKELFSKYSFSAVINFAAESHVDRSICDPEVFLTTNILGTAALMDACREFGGIRFHQISTDEVYGDLPLDRKDVFFTENTPIRASSPYSSSKAAADLLAMAYYRTYGLPITISRCSNNYGPHQHVEKLIPRMIFNALHNECLPVYGNGQNVRDWIYVTDHCEAIDMILQKGRVGEIYNVGGHNERRNIDIVKLICRKLEKPEALITFVEDRKGHDLRYAIDPGKILNETGWYTKTAFEDGISKTIQWYCALYT